MRKPVVIVGAVALAAVVALLVSPAEAAAPAARDHVVTVAGSDGYLVYEVARSGKDVQAGNRNGGTLRSRDAAGRTRTLTGFTDGIGVIEQTGHTLLQKTFRNVTVDGVTTGVERLRLRDLRTGTDRVIDLDPGSSLASVAPDGYVVREDLGDGDGGSYAGPTRLTYRHLDGSSSALPAPFADGTDYRLQASDHGLLATTPSSDEQTRPSRIAYLTWARPAAWHHVYDARGPQYIGCATPSRTHVACRVDGIDSGGPGLMLFRLADGHAVRLLDRHPKACTAAGWATRGADLIGLETTDAGPCTKGRLFRLHDDGTLVRGSARYRYSALGSIVTAYRQVVLSSADQRRLLTTTGATRKPVVLVPR